MSNEVATLLKEVIKLLKKDEAKKTPPLWVKGSQVFKTTIFNTAKRLHDAKTRGQIVQKKKGTEIWYDLNSVANEFKVGND